MAHFSIPTNLIKHPSSDMEHSPFNMEIMLAFSPDFISPGDSNFQHMGMYK
jgi:hypothetical protein